MPCPKTVYISGGAAGSYAVIVTAPLLFRSRATCQSGHLQKCVDASDCRSVVVCLCGPQGHGGPLRSHTAMILVGISQRDAALQQLKCSLDVQCPGLQVEKLH